MVIDLPIDTNLALDHFIQLFHAYYLLPMNVIKTLTTINMTGLVFIDLKKALML